MGLYLALFTLASILTILFLNNKFTKFFSNYYIIAICSIIFFIYFWFIRYQEDITNFINKTSYINGINNPDLLLQDRWHSISFSKALLLDLCPFSTMMFSFLLTLDRKRTILKVIAPYAFFGGCITIFGQIIGDEVGSTNNNLYEVTNVWDFIFGNKAYFTMHYFLVVVSLVVVMNSNGYTWKNLIGTIVFPITYFSYIMIIVTQFNITQNATGLVEGDWGPGGQYYIVAQLFNNMSFPWVAVFCYSIVYIYILAWMFFRNILINDGKWKTNPILFDSFMSWFIHSKFILKINSIWNNNKIKDVKYLEYLNTNQEQYFEFNHSSTNCSICQKRDNDLSKKNNQTSYK